MNLKLAQQIATDICYKLQPYCDKINIAGSIRRKKSDVKDIEIVCQPKTQNTSVNNLFGETNEIIIKSEKFTEIINTLGAIVKGKTSGKMMQIQLPEWIMLDLFIPDDFDYFRQFAIRTGSADYSHRVIATGWRKKGFCGSDVGLRKISDCIEKKLPDGKVKWECVNPNAEKPPAWEDEKSFFEWLQISYLKPELRS